MKLTMSEKKLKTYLHFWISNKKIDDWAKSKNIFFILAIGRSGTRFFSGLLNQIKEAYVVHEPVPDDFYAHQRAFHSEKDAYNYIMRFRKREIYLRIRDMKIAAYGEVNSALRRHCRALKKAFPNAKFLHLIRDGRDVVRSMMSRKTMTEGDPNTRLIFPPEGDPWRGLWSRMSRFEKICWYWQVENNYLRHNISRTVQFEKLISDYRYFKENLLTPLDLRLSEDVWKAEVNRPVNITRSFVIPHWKAWDNEMVEKFNNICGEEMKENGYDI